MGRNIEALEYGLTPLLTAVSNFNPGTAEVLLQRGGNIEATLRGSNILETARSAIAYGYEDGAGNEADMQEERREEIINMLQRHSIL